MDNNFEPGSPDRRQPTTFLEGRHEHVFTIVAPKELTGKLIWTIKSEMGVQTANASFDQLYILAVREGDAPNAKAPEIAIADVTARVGQPALLSPSITPAANSERADTEGGASEAVGLNVEWSTYRGRGRVAFSAAPSAAQAASVEAGRRRSRAEPERPGIHTVACGMKPAAGCGAAIAVFGEPGVYTLRAAARQDGMQGLAFVRVTVNP